MALTFAIVTGIISGALGVGLVLRAESAFGAAWAAVFVVPGVVAIVGAVISARRSGPRATGSRAATLAVLLLLAAWCAVVGAIGAVQESWIWGLLMALPAAYLLRVVVRVVRAPRSTR